MDEVAERQWEAMERVRLDKWLWAARFYKTRSLAAKACELGRVELHGQPAKPASGLQAGESLRVTTPGGVFEVEVLALSDQRGPAAVAQTLYRETAASREARARAAEERKALPWYERLGEGRPTKRDRRQLDRLRGSF